jgi:hypothetical protein
VRTKSALSVPPDGTSKVRSVVALTSVRVVISTGRSVKRPSVIAEEPLPAFRSFPVAIGWQRHRRQERGAENARR